MPNSTNSEAKPPTTTLSTPDSSPDSRRDRKRRIRCSVVVGFRDEQGGVRQDPRRADRGGSPCARRAAEVRVTEFRFPPWQPIETAPKDGSTVLVFRPADRHERIGIDSFGTVDGYPHAWARSTQS